MTSGSGFRNMCIIVALRAILKALITTIELLNRHVQNDRKTPELVTEFATMDTIHDLREAYELLPDYRPDQEEE